MFKEFIDEVKCLYEKLLNNDRPFLDDFFKKWNIEGSIGEVYQNLCKKELKKEMGSFYTPYEIVDFMVDEMIKGLNYCENPFVKIVDPSCGGGYFLTAAFKKLIVLAEEAGIENPGEHVLNHNIYGYDIDENAVMITTLELFNLTGHVTRNIKCQDFLMTDGEFDVVIGNPPYMGHKVLKGEYREKLCKIFQDVFQDKADLSYCFIKKSIESLRYGGRLIFFTSRYLLEALHGRGIREFIKNSGQIESLIDFYGIRVVKGAGVDNIILIFKKGSIDRFINFFRLKHNGKEMGNKVFEDIACKREKYSKFISFDSKFLDNKGWVFLDDKERSILNKIKGVELNCICESFQGIITGCDAAFILSNERAKELNIEADIIKPWIKNKNIDSFKVKETQELIIYSDLIENEEEYKNALNYISKHREILEKRRECIRGVRKWYQLQWGRKEYIFEEKKIVYPFKASRNRFAIDEGSYFSADVYIIKLRNMFIDKISYEFLVGVLNSSVYEFYIKTMAKKLGDELYEYYPNKIMTLKIPEYIKEIEEEVLKGGEDIKERVDNILLRYFNITQDEYEVIKGWTS